MERDIQKITRYFVIGALLISSISLILPWGISNISLTQKSTFYSWGVNVNSLTGNTNQWKFYFEFIDVGNIKSIFGMETSSLGFIQIILGILVSVFILAMIAIGIVNLRQKILEKRLILEIVIWGVASIISFFIFIQFGISLLQWSVVFPFTYSIGFTGMIFSLILLMVAYFIIDMKTPELDESDIPIKTSDESPSDILKLRFAKGEITEDEFEKMKKKLEG